MWRIQKCQPDFLPNAAASEAPTLIRHCNSVGPRRGIFRDVGHIVSVCPFSFIYYVSICLFVLSCVIYCYLSVFYGPCRLSQNKWWWWWWWLTPGFKMLAYLSSTFGRISRFLRRNILSRVLRLELNETERNRTPFANSAIGSTCSRQLSACEQALMHYFDKRQNGHVFAIGFYSDCTDQQWYRSSMSKRSQGLSTFPVRYGWPPQLLLSYGTEACGETGTIILLASG